MAVWKKLILHPTPQQGTGVDIWTSDCFRSLIDTFLLSWDCVLVEKDFKTDIEQTDLTIGEDTVISYRYYDHGAHIYINDEYFSEVAESWHIITSYVVYSDSFFYLAHNLDDGRVLTYLYEIIDDTIYEGWDKDSDRHRSTFQNLELSIKYDEEDPPRKFIHGKILDYRNQFKYIDYTDSTLFDITDGETNYINLTDDNFISCSTVPVDTIISFDETRHFSLDTNTLVAINPVEPYEEEGTEEEEEEE